jgi:hypothetical protein
VGIRRYLSGAIFLSALILPAAARAQMPWTSFVAEARVNVAASFMPTLVLGGRFAGRVQVGLGFGLVRNSPGTPTATNPTTTSFAASPQLAVDLVKLLDERVDFYARVGLPIGFEAIPDNHLFGIGWEASLGMRSSFFGYFALGFEAGFAGFYIDPGGTRGSGTTSAFGAAVGTFYWGKPVQPKKPLIPPGAPAPSSSPSS